ncbi:MAG: YdcF family protein [Acidobacteria bacterium]|nr:YdcF family protein [Acidobacteriota bacterium]
MFRLLTAPLRWVLGILSSLIGLGFLYGGVTFTQIWLTGRDHSSAHADAILVFGTAEDNGVPSTELRDRLLDALSLYQARRAPWVVVTGGSRPGDHFTEAGVSASFLEAHGVPASRIIIGGGNDTWQNVSSVVVALESHHLRTVLTVTDPFHEYRAGAIASSQGLVPYPVPVSNSATSGPGLWRFYAKETLDVAVGRLVGFGRLSSWTQSHHVTLPFLGPTN